MKHIVIIGNGISGITAARHIRKLSNNKITVISSETEYFFSRTALMYVYMGHMKFENTKPYEDWFWKKNKIDLLKAHVDAIDTDGNQLLLDNGEKLSYDQLILAVGSKPNKFGWPGQDLRGVQGLYSFQDLQLMESNTKGIKKAVIVGGGLIGIEMVEMLKSRNIEVTFLVRENSFWDVVLPKEESNLINRHIKEHHVDLRLSTELKEITADESGNVKSVITNHGEEIRCGFVGLTVGVRPNIDFLVPSNIATDKGILVDKFLTTNIPNIYAIGDCAQFSQPIANRRSIEQVWYTGRMMGETIAYHLCKNPVAYEPGIWFNSAKFFDLEYQTYGHVWAKLKENEVQYYWEHADGKKCMKFVFDSHSRRLLGINTFGIRLRHQVFDQWLSAAKTIDYVIDNLEQANFDPEFFKKNETEIKQQFLSKMTLKSNKV